MSKRNIHISTILVSMNYNHSALEFGRGNTVRCGLLLSSPVVTPLFSGLFECAGTLLVGEKHGQRRAVLARVLDLVRRAASTSQQSHRIPVLARPQLQSSQQLGNTINIDK